MVTVVIKYHDPALARYLDNYEIEPQIYCISWLMTLFSRYRSPQQANCRSDCATPSGS
jgi:hypothetical protein